jgi:hypothetical protein
MEKTKPQQKLPKQLVRTWLMLIGDEDNDVSRRAIMMIQEKLGSVKNAMRYAKD